MTAWDRLSRRERFLVIALIAGAVPIALWALVAVPLQESRDRAFGEVAGAQADYVWAAEKVQQFTVLADRNVPEVLEPAGIAGLEEALIADGLRSAVTALETTRNGGLRLRINDISFDVFGRFLEAAVNRLGYQIATLRITPLQRPGQIEASLDLVPATIAN